LRRVLPSQVAALERHLSQLASALLPRGMTAKLFAELANRAFARVAAEAATFSTGKVNYSRVAARIGLSRSEVRRLLTSSWHESRDENDGPLQRVIRGWRSDRQFVDARRRPRVLRVSGRRGSFALLVRKHGGDLPHRAVLEELLQLGLVSETDNSVRLISRSAAKKTTPHRHVRCAPRKTPKI